jgi:hypothetical protein
MPDTVFNEAYTRVRARYSDQAWFRQTAREITNAIYAEIRAIDRERLLAGADDRKVAMAVAAE